MQAGNFPPYVFSRRRNTNEWIEGQAAREKGIKGGTGWKGTTAGKQKKMAGDIALGNRRGMRDNRIDRMERAGCCASAAANSGSRRCANAVRIACCQRICNAH